MKKNTLVTNIFFNLVLLLSSLVGFAQSQTYSTPGTATFTVPAGVTSVTVEAWGGGGRGGSANIAGSNQAGGGGGGGAYSRKIITVTPLTGYSVVVGGGGTSGTIDGGDSFFINSTTIIARGGKSVLDNNTAGGTQGIWNAGDGDSGFSGGNGATGNTSSFGAGGGSSAGTAVAGNAGSAQNAGTAPVGGSAGGNGAASNGSGSSATGFGGGGGGARKGTGSAVNSGGNGANGQVIITWIAPPGTYCNTTYSSGPGTIDLITNVTLGTLNNTSGASSSPFYTFYNASIIPNLTQSGTASVSVSFGSDGTQFAAVWIDFNQNGTFEIGEGAISGNAGSNGTIIINIPIPAGAILGNTRMRVRGGDDVALTTSQSCGASSSNFGETEDYIVNIVPSSPPTITSLGSVSGCVGSSITINGTNLTGATASGVRVGGTAVSSITSNTGTVLIAVIGSGTTGTVAVTTTGGTATSAATFTVNPLPAQPSPITGNSTPCSGTSQTYSVTNVSGVTYNWLFPAGWIQTSGGTTNSVIVTTNGNSGTISVTPSNPCVGTAVTLSVTSVTIPSQPSAIIGNATPCSSTSQIYSVTNVPGTTYLWTFPSGWSQTAGGTTNSITVTTSGTSGTITVTPSNSCGNGTAQTLITTVNSVIPVQPSPITGNISFCSGTSQTFSVTNVAGTTYTWTFPSGWSQTAGGTTNSITVTTNGTSGTISVTPSNGCTSGTARTLATTVIAAPTITAVTPGSRTGAGTVNLGATASAGTISWFANLTGGSAIGTGTNFTTPAIIITTTYFVETTNGACTSSPRVPVVATVNFPEITVLGNGNIIMDEDITPIITDFTNLGSSVVGVGITKSYIINNSGTVALTIGALTIGGLHASEFVVTAAPAASLAPGANTTFSILFTPTALGIRNANLSFTTNDPDENPFNFDIAGVGSTGLIPEINVQGIGNTIIDGDTGATTADGTDFASVTIPGTLVRTFTIQNTGTGPLVLTGSPLVVITGSPYFTVTAQPTSNTIAAGSSLTFQVTYNPLLTGSSVAIVSINNDDTDENVYDFTIIGSAVVSGIEIDVQGNDESILDGDTTPSAVDQTDFGVTDAVTPITLTYNIFSAGSSSLSLTPTIAITGTNAAMFTATNLVSSLGAGGITSFVITFTPSAVLGIKTATITITNNDSNEGTYNFDIKADVQVFPALTVAPGGITSNIKFWLKADSNIGLTSDNTSIVSWEDKTSGGTKNAVSKFGREPKFQNNPTYNVNFNPVIRFNGSSVMSGGQGFNNSDMYIVVKPTNPVTFTSSPMDVYCGDDITSNKNNQDVTGFEMGNTSSRHSQELIAYNQAANTSFGVAEISTTKFYSGANIFNPRKDASFPTVKMNILHNGTTLNTSSVQDATYRDIVNTRYWLGRSEFYDASYDGDILEVINYNVRNSDTDKRKIETYLAIKYGITLGTNGTSLDYLNSDGSIIYEAGAGFNFNIAGIGRDDKSQLNQKQSKTENTNNDITIGLDNIFDINSNNTNAFDADKKFLVWGHNNNTLAAQAPILVDMSTGITAGGALTTMVDFISIARTWRVKETGGDVPSVKISIPSSVITATITPPGDFLMFISDSPVFNPTAEYRIMRVNGSKLEVDYDFNGTKYITFGYAPEKTFVRSISFDGTNDYLDAGKVLNLNTSFTVSSWIKRNGTNRTILSKRNNSFTQGYDLSINAAGRAEMSWINGTKQTITSSVVIPAGIWHNVAVTYSSGTARLYIDGVLDVSRPMSAVPSNTQSFLIAAADGTSTTSFFNGGLDEVRVWNVALTDKQLRYVMNQEISRDATLTGGRTIPNNITLNDIKAIPWVNLSAYYPMSTYTFTNAKDVSNNNFTAALKNLTTVDRQTAPLPYESNSNGNWQTPATWLNSAVQNLPNCLSIVDNATPIDWNIVRTSHDITSTGNKTVLGLMVMNQTLTALSDSKIEVTNYLDLDGKIDLVGMSQLVQTLNSDLDVTSAGSIERDQRGQANIYNYNYWCSPVSPINATANNTNYTVAGVMKDGTSTTCTNINWISGHNASISTPINISRFWLYKFDNFANSYSNWERITENSSLRVGQGYTMKGSGAVGSQNYTFLGKPNNGVINSNTVLSDQLVLTGNPYPSALDAQSFINDNAGSIDGTLYFWEHYTTNNTHVLQEYQGGYGVYNLTGGIAPVSTSVDFISQSGSSLKPAPKRYIPVGQGFFVNGKIGSGGIITFNNNQRAFFKENETNSNSLYKQRPNAAKTSAVDHWNDNSNDSAPESTYKKLKLGFTSSNNYHRQVLLGFMNEKATSTIDYGYDGITLDDLPDDIYFVNGEHQLVIQGEGYFDESASYPIGVKTSIEGKVIFNTDALENINTEQKIYIYDDETKMHNEIQKIPYEVNMPIGINNTRFSLRFEDKSMTNNKALSVDENDLNIDGIKIAYIQNNDSIKINNPSKETTVEKVNLFNINGQSVASWKIENQDQENIQISINTISSGVYIAKLTTTRGVLSKKLIVK